MLQEFAAALKAAKVEITRFDPSKDRNAITSSAGKCSVEKFCEVIKSRLKSEIVKFPEVARICYDPVEMAATLQEYSKEKKVLVGEGSVEVPEKYLSLTLNLDETHQGKELKFFCTTPEEFVSDVSGSVYIRACGMSDPQAAIVARKVTPVYLPHNPPGITHGINAQNEEIIFFNTYVPPLWKLRHPKDIGSSAALFRRVVNHLFPDKNEREFFYVWLYTSLTDRAFTYLVLCGAPGIGKNILKRIMKALHGHHNTVDGKKSSLTERFNSQFTDSTLCWFDELSYDLKMENFLKELQNDSIAIEKKGVDATKSSKIHSSFVISNNKPRDNYLAFEARKFVPLKLTDKRLETALNPDEITRLVKKVENPNIESFDIAFLQHCFKHIEEMAKPNLHRWPNLEYKGPMFYKLCHTSMSMWQKRVASFLLDMSPRDEKSLILDPDKGFLWSSIERKLSAKDGQNKKIPMPEYSTVQSFLNLFKGSKGEKAFETKIISGSLVGDFYVKIVNKTKVVTEEQVDEELGIENPELSVETEVKAEDIL